MYVKLLNHFGTDQEICAAARISYNNHNQIKTDADNQKLLDYLAIHGHSSPFEQAEYQFLIKIPLFVFGQLVRHRTASINCKSYRYTEVEDATEFFIPDSFREANEKKQGSSDRIIDNNEFIKEICEQKCSNDLKFYTLLLEEGVCREQARMFLPQNVYTEFVWKIDFRNLFHFIKLRIHSTAQKEIQDLAIKLYEIARVKNPMACNAMHLSEKIITKQELKFILKNDIDGIKSQSRKAELKKLIEECTAF